MSSFSRTRRNDVTCRRGGRQAALSDLMSQRKEKDIGQRRRRAVIEDEVNLEEKSRLVGSEETDGEGLEMPTTRNMSLVKYQDGYYKREIVQDLSSDMEDFIVTSDMTVSTSHSSGELPDDHHGNGDGGDMDGEQLRISKEKKKRKGACASQQRVKKPRNLSLLISSSSSSHGHGDNDDDDGGGGGGGRRLEHQDGEEEFEILSEQKVASQGEKGKILVRKRTCGALTRPGEGPILRERKVADTLSPLERIRNAQKLLLSQEKDSVGTTDDSCSLLTDEGDPSLETSTSSGRVSEDKDEGNRGVLSSRVNDGIWRKEAEKLGINTMSEEDAFKAYIEYLFICSIDPLYEDHVKQSNSHRLLYSQAIRKIEYLLIQAQEYVHSESWRCCDLFLLESLERHPFVERISQNDPSERDEFQCSECPNICAACGKGNGWINVEFKGDALNQESYLTGEHDADMMLSQKYALASPVYQRNRGLASHSCRPVGNVDDAERMEEHRHFWLGATCLKRIFIFHALFHFRYHCIIFLKRQALKAMKNAQDGGAPLTMDGMLDIVLNDTNHQRMYSCFTSMLLVAKSYQIAGGSEKHLFGTRNIKYDPPQYALLYGDFNDIPDINPGKYLADT